LSLIQINWTRIPHIPSMITVAMIPDDRAAYHESIGERLADAMCHNDHTRPSREMREDEEHAEPIMRHEAYVPGVFDEAGRSARREAPAGVDAEIRPCENEDRTCLID
jgi:hypothetical protein